VTAKAYYERYWSDEGFFPRGRMTAPLAALFRAHVPAGADCLDLGCGDGRASGLWLKQNARSYVGVDISENAVRQARAAGLDARVIMDATRLPFSERSFDVAVCLEVLEHVFEPAAVATELARVLRPGGVVLVTVPNVAYWRRRLDFFFLGRWNPLGDDRSTREPWRDPHVRFFTRKTLAAMLEGTGFREVLVGGHGGTILGDVPVARGLCRARCGWATPGWISNPIYSRLEAGLPALLGYRLHGVGRKT